MIGYLSFKEKKYISRNSADNFFSRVRQSSLYDLQTCTSGKKQGQFHFKIKGKKIEEGHDIFIDGTATQVAGDTKLQVSYSGGSCFLIFFCFAFFAIPPFMGYGFHPMNFFWILIFILGIWEMEYYNTKEHYAQFIEVFDLVEIS